MGRPSRHILNRFRNFMSDATRQYAMIGFMLFIGGVGAVLLFGSKAATPTASSEAESGTLSAQTTKLSNAAASGGSYIKFGAGGGGGASAFRFAAWADTKSGTATLSSISKQAWPLNPKFVLYPGDLCDSGPDATCFQTWKTALNGSGDMLSKSFVTRGNHDSSGTSYWSSAFNFASVATSIGATNFTGDDFTYSFDYGNSHFVGIDMPGGGATSMTSSQITWADNDLTAAEARGKIHSFLFFHGPPVPEGGHCCTNAPSVIAMIGKHTSVAATFNGHEHNEGYTLVDSRSGNTGHPFYEFIVGGGGAGLYDCQRGDYCTKSYGFASVDVSGATVTMNLYILGNTTPAKTITLTQ